jgi:serine protease Do
MRKIKMKTSNFRLKRLTGVLLASAFAVTAIGLAPDLTNYTPSDTALAEAVMVEAPSAPNFADVVEAVSPAVVSVRVESDLQPGAERGFRFDRRGDGEFRLPPFMRDHPFFRDDDNRRDEGRRFDRRRGERRHGEGRPHRFGMSQGSGFFVSEDGYLVTNHHVVENGSKFTVVMDDGTEYDARLVGADNRTDLAVLKVEEERDFTYVQFDNDEIRVGEWVVAVGNPFGLGGTVTAGIVSAHNRALRTARYDDFIQIDAAVNKGNSGGPAFNLNGEVIGINTAIFSPSGGNVGIAFAIPASTASEIINDLIENGHVVRGWLGVHIQPVTGDIADSVGLEEPQGAIVTEPQDESPADRAGIRSGDVIMAVNGDDVSNPRDLARKIAGYDPESKVTITLWREGASQDIEVELGTLDEQAARVIPDARPEGSDIASLGLELESDPDLGVVITGIVPDSGADEKGLRAGDVVTSVNGEAVSSPDDVARIVSQADELGRKATLFQIRRGENSRFVAIPFERG